MIFLLPSVLARVFRLTFLDVFGVTNLQLETVFSLYPSALYESPFSNLHAEALSAFFLRSKNVIEGVSRKLETVFPNVSVGTQQDNA